MHSCLNDFVIIDARANDHNLEEIQKIVPKIASRNEGIGCDQVLVITHSKQAACKMIVYNADASESGMCANGLRCVGRLMAEENNRDKNKIEISGVNYKTKRMGEITIAVNVGKPKISWQEIPLLHDMATPALKYSFGKFKDPIVLNVGNPHAIFFIDQDIALEEINLSRVGNQIENDPLFSEGVNVSFVKIWDKNNLITRVWERGVGETKSCGSAASAIGWASIFTGRKVSPVTVHLPGGEITVEILDDGTIESTAETEIVSRNETFELII